jgi:MFS family permease
MPVTPADDAHAQRIRDRRTWRGLLRGNVLWLSIVSLLNDTASEMIYPLLPFFLVGSLGASAAVLGLVEGVAESTSSLLKLASGWVSDRLRRRRPLVIGGYAIASAARPVIALATSPWHVLVIRFADRVGKGVRAAPRDALLADSVDEAVRGRAFGIHRAADHTGAFLGPLVASALLLVLDGDLRAVFALAAIPGAVTIAVLLARVREPPPVATADTVAAAQPLPDTTPTFRRYLAVLALFTLGNATDAFLLLRAGDLGVPLAAIPLLWSVHHATKSATSIPGGVLADRIGPGPTIVAGWLIYAATYAAFAFAADAWHVWALFTVYGLFHGLTEAPEKALVAQLTGEGTRGMAFGAYHFTVGIAALPASIAFGLLWQRFGPAAAFLTGAALALVAALLLPALVPAARLRRA